MNFNKKFCLLMLILFFISLSFVSATSDNNQTIGAIDNEGLSATSATFSDFQTDIETAGDTIDLTTDYTYDTGFDKAGIVINKTITIKIINREVLFNEMDL